MQRLDKIYSAKIFGKYLQITVTEETNMFKVNNRNTRTWCEICSKLTIKTPERHQFLLLTLSMFHTLF